MTYSFHFTCVLEPFLPLTPPTKTKPNQNKQNRKLKNYISRVQAIFHSSLQGLSPITNLIELCQQLVIPSGSDLTPPESNWFLLPTGGPSSSGTAACHRQEQSMQMWLIWLLFSCSPISLCPC